MYNVYNRYTKRRIVRIIREMREEKKTTLTGAFCESNDSGFLADGSCSFRQVGLRIHFVKLARLISIGAAKTDAGRMQQVRPTRGTSFQLVLN